MWLAADGVPGAHAISHTLLRCNTRPSARSLQACSTVEMEIRAWKAVSANVSLSFVAHKINVCCVTGTELLMDTCRNLLLWREKKADKDQRHEIRAHSSSHRPMLWAIQRIRLPFGPSLEFGCCYDKCDAAHCSSEDGLWSRHANPVQANHGAKVQHDQHERSGPACKCQGFCLTPATVRPQSQKKRKAEREGDRPCCASTRNAQPAQCNTRICLMP
mmetsp:Transcript_133902/g.317460  ORF Transcript_133902/g.317460 Transcript_133902/m.317460 type:complete len:217 (-) Transcript_133902:529-1179(-)